MLSLFELEAIQKFLQVADKLVERLDNIEKAIRELSDEVSDLDL